MRGPSNFGRAGVSSEQIPLQQNYRRFSFVAPASQEFLKTTDGLLPEQPVPVSPKTDSIA